MFRTRPWLRFVTGPVETSYASRRLRFPSRLVPRWVQYIVYYIWYVAYISLCDRSRLLSSKIVAAQGSLPPAAAAATFRPVGAEQAAPTEAAKIPVSGVRGAKIACMTQEQEKIIAALEKGEATAQQQKEAVRMIRDLDRELRELLEWQQGD